MSEVADSKPQLSEEEIERLARIEAHAKAVHAVEGWKQKNVTKLSNFDQDYQAKAFQHSTAQAKNFYFLQDRAEMEACKHAFIHGFVSGSMYGGALGLGMSMYRRQIRHIPIMAVGLGATYGMLLGSSAWFRFDI